MATPLGFEPTPQRTPSTPSSPARRPVPEPAPVAAGGTPPAETAASRRPRLLTAERRLVLFVGDLLLAVSWAWLGALLTRQAADGGGGAGFRWNLALAVVFLLVASISGAYDLRQALRPRRAMARVAQTTALTGVLYLLGFYVLGRPIFAFDSGQGLTPLVTAPPRIAPMVFLVATSITVLLWRVVFARVFTSTALRHRVLVVGAGASGRRLLDDMAGMPHHYRVLGLVDDDPSKADLLVAGLPVLCDRSGLVETVRRLGVSEVILATTQALHPELLRELLRCYELGIAVRPMPAVYEELAGRVPVEHLGQKWFLAPFWNQLGLPGVQAAAKRALDVVVAVGGLALTAVLLPLVALAIRLDSPGPLLYAQERLGRGGRPFRLFKFRSMTTAAESDGVAVWSQRSDPRVTRVGAALRRSRLDELPQFWNVLRGEMSVVGPRPERAAFIERLEEAIPFYRTRLAVKPGLTGWAQINYPYGSSVEDALRKLEYDLYYVKNQGLVLDLLIILRTLGVVLTLRGH
ncbi:MAG TPA: sugar transferase [Thermoanaerobaculia bacterium]|nr:sugar transferase [Thermoanaerobaculia bacterium]